MHRRMHQYALRFAVRRTTDVHWSKRVRRRLTGSRMSESPTPAAEFRVVKIWRHGIPGIAADQMVRLGTDGGIAADVRRRHPAGRADQPGSDVVVTTVTWSKVATQSVPSWWLVTARPMNAFAPIAIDCAPTACQITPS